MIEEGTAGQFDFREEIGKRVRRSQGINQLSLLPIRQELLIDAQLLFRSSFAFFKMSCSSFRRLTSC